MPAAGRAGAGRRCAEPPPPSRRRRRRPSAPPSASRRASASAERPRRAAAARSTRHDPPSARRSAAQPPRSRRDRAARAAVVRPAADAVAGAGRAGGPAWRLSAPRRQADAAWRRAGRATIPISATHAAEQSTGHRRPRGQALLPAAAWHAVDSACRALCNNLQSIGRGCIVVEASKMTLPFRSAPLG